MEERQVDVVVVGAGLSGLSAAYRLWTKDPSLTVAVLDAKDRIGGRTVGRRLKVSSETDAWDLGGQWVGKTQVHVLQLIEELGLEVYQEYCNGRNLMQLCGDDIQEYSGDIPALPWYCLVDIHFMFSKVNRMSQSIDVSDPSKCPMADEWDSITVEYFMRKHLWTEGAREAILAAFRCIFAAEPIHLSLLYFLTYVRAAGGIDALIGSDPKVGGQGFKVEGGAWRISHRLLDRIGAKNVHLNTTVTQITQTDEKVTIATNAQVKYVCDRVIVTLPPHQTAKINFKPSLPIEKLQVLRRMTPGDVTKVIVTYKTPFWREQGFSGQVVTNGGPSLVEGCSTGPLCLVFDGMSAEGNHALVSFIGGKQQREYCCIEPSKRKHAVLQSLRDFFGPSAFDCLDYCELNWNDEDHSSGGPVSVACPGAATGFRHLRSPYKRIHFAGTESATAWMGFMNGAVQSGFRAASEVLYNLRPQVMSAGDLCDTAYDDKHLTMEKILERKSRPYHVIRWTLGLGLLCAALLITTKACVQSS